MSPSGRIPPVGDGEGDSEGDELVGGVCPPSEGELFPCVQEVSIARTNKLVVRKEAEGYPETLLRARGMRRLYRPRPSGTWSRPDEWQPSLCRASRTGKFSTLATRNRGVGKAISAASIGLRRDPWISLSYCFSGYTPAHRELEPGRRRTEIRKLVEIAIAEEQASAIFPRRGHHDLRPLERRAEDLLVSR